MNRAGGPQGYDYKCFQNWSENVMGREHLGKLDVDGRIILSHVSRK
jgi:hypothetical protein